MTNLKCPSQDTLTQDKIRDFTIVRVTPIPELHSTAYEFKHNLTSARVLHLYNDDPNNLFSIAFRTPVKDSTGVPHILEHSVLCGSKKFPIKDPFQELLKGSLQTFLNALTYPDKTVYPVSSQVEKDFYNLVDIYCDAVFNPLLSENTFYQEGWHFDVEDMTKPFSIKGIVYNEMKGVFSDFSSHVDRRAISTLFPDTTYFFESGGDPEHITDLTYEQFKNFHKTLYHPSNSYIFLYGNLASDKTLSFLHENYLKNFSAIKIDSSIKMQQLWKETRSIVIDAPAPQEDDGTSTVALLWLYGNSSDPVSVLSGRILSYYLLGTESSPLKRALIDSGLGEDLDDISGFETDLVQTIFAAGLRKADPNNADKIQACIIDTLKKIICEGIDEELLEGSVRQIEFNLREIAGGHVPYNLRLAERAYRSWIYDGDPLAHLAFDKPLSIVKDHFSKGSEYFISLIKANLLDNNHRLLAVIRASSKMGKELEQQTERQVQRLTNSFSDDHKKKFHELTNILIKEQKTPPSQEGLAKLPKLYKTDLPRKGQEVPTNLGKIGTVPLYAHPIFTSGIAYLDMGFDARGVPEELISYLPLYSELITRCGTKKYSYEKMSKRIALSTGGIEANASCKMKLQNNDLFFNVFFFGKCLENRFGEMLGIFQELFLEGKLSNKKQMKDLLLEERNSLNAMIIHNGHQFAMTESSSRLTLSRYIDELLGGITQLRFLDSLIRKNNLDEIINALETIHSIIVNKNAAVLSLTASNPDQFTNELSRFMDVIPAKEFKVQSYTHQQQNLANKGIEISSAVNFVAESRYIDRAQAADAGILFLMTRLLSTGYLWDKVRVEGGAYGGMASMSITHPVFSCASYRDPNLFQTLKHFELGLKEIAQGISTDKVDQSIIGTIGRIDSPRTPHGQGLGETVDLLIGNTPEYRQNLRDAVLSATPESLKKASEKILNSPKRAVTILGNSASFDKAEKEGLSIVRESLL